MTNLPPPPPPPSAPAPWYRTTSGAIALGVVAVLVGVVIYLLMRDGEGGVAGSSTTAAGSTTSVTTLAPSSTTSSTAAATTTSTSTPTSTSTTTIAATTTSTVTTAPLTLDYSLPANYGEFDLDSGFQPDPASYDATSGGSVNASYLGGGCYGFASAAPDLKINYTAGAYPLRFYFLPDTPGADTVLLINAPDGSWYCNDDSWGTYNPTVDFADPLGGRYDIWLASIGQTDTHPGTLYVTELTSNHP